MTLKPPASRSNYINDAAKKHGSECVSIVSDGCSVSSKVQLSDGTNLGLVQRVTWSIGVAEPARCTIETIASPAEVAALMENTTVKVQPWYGPSGNPIRWLWVYYTAAARRWFNSLRS